jgi:hypothetical protein
LVARAASRARRRDQRDRPRIDHRRRAVLSHRNDRVTARHSSPTRDKIEAGLLAAYTALFESCQSPTHRKRMWPVVVSIVSSRAANSAIWAVVRRDDGSGLQKVNLNTTNRRSTSAQLRWMRSLQASGTPRWSPHHLRHRRIRNPSRYDLPASIRSVIFFRNVSRYFPDHDVRPAPLAQGGTAPWRWYQRRVRWPGSLCGSAFGLG